MVESLKTVEATEVALVDVWLVAALVVLFANVWLVVVLLV
jgi:hypothetical protein